MKTRRSLGQIQSASPCSSTWGQMLGDEQVRRCGRCNLNVYQLDGLTPEDADDLLYECERHEGAKLFQRHDGTLMTRDCPMGRREKAKRYFFWAGAAVVVVLAVMASWMIQQLADRPNAGIAANPWDRLNQLFFPPPARVMPAAPVVIMPGAMGEVVDLVDFGGAAGGMGGAPGAVDLGMGGAPGAAEMPGFAPPGIPNAPGGQFDPIGPLAPGGDGGMMPGIGGFAPPRAPGLPGFVPPARPMPPPED